MTLSFRRRLKIRTRNSHRERYWEEFDRESYACPSCGYESRGIPREFHVHHIDGSFFRQEVEGAFTKFEGLVYPWFSRQEHVIDEQPDDYDEVIYGVDWGFNNPGVILALVRRGDQWAVVEEFYESRCTDDDMAEHARDMIDRWGPGRIYCDPAEPASIETF